MNRVLARLLLLSAVTLPTGCVITEAVTPPPPKISDLPTEAVELFAKPIPQCEDPAKVGMSIDEQNLTIGRQRQQIQRLIDSENTRWELRRSYLERELRFYQRELGQTPGNWQYTYAPMTAGPLRVGTSALGDEVRRKQQREYNERQMKRFTYELNKAKAHHDERITYYLARVSQLDNATKVCGELKVNLRKAREEAELQKATRPVPDLAPKIETQRLPEVPLIPEPQSQPLNLPPQQQAQTLPALPMPSAVSATSAAETPMPTAPSQPVQSPIVSQTSAQHWDINEAENMEELLQQTAPAVAKTMPPNTPEPASDVTSSSAPAAANPSPAVAAPTSPLTPEAPAPSVTPSEAPVTADAVPATPDAVVDLQKQNAAPRIAGSAPPAASGNATRPSI